MSLEDWSDVSSTSSNKSGASDCLGGGIQHEQKERDPRPPTDAELANDEQAGTDKKLNRNWIFTWNNYTDEDVNDITKMWPNMTGFRCVVYGKETAPTTGTPHLQGFICWKTAKSLAQLKKLSPKIRFIPMNGTIDQNKTYCSKDDPNMTIIGDVPITNVEKGKHGIKGKAHGEKGKEAPGTWPALIKDIEAGKTRHELMREYPKLAGEKTKGFMTMLEEFKPKTKFSLIDKFGSLYAWQKELIDILAKGPNPRSVQWIYTNEGGVGKSDMAKHLESDGFEYLMNSTTRDLACAWQGNHVVFDFARDLGDVKINYAIIEQIKNKRVFSAKYESQIKRTEKDKDVFVVCFSNEPPDTAKLSKDRWEIFEIVDKKLVHRPVA